MSRGLNRQQGEPGGVNILQAPSYGGLNTTASPINMATEDSPSMLNMKVNQSGTISKRAGSVALSDKYHSNPNGTSVVAFNTRTGFRLLFAKEGTDLTVSYITSNRLNFVYQSPRLVKSITFSGVWSQEAAGVRFDHVITSEPVARIIMTTGVNTPIQASILQTGGISNTAVLDTGDTRLAGVLKEHTFVFRNGTLVPRSEYTVTGAGVINFTGGGFSGTFVYDVIAISWQWWVEAIALKGKQITREVTQFQVSEPTDRTVAIPTDLMFDIEPLGESNFPITAYGDTAMSVHYPVSTVSNDATTHVWTQGAPYFTGTRTNAGFTHIAFGDFTAALPTTPKRIILWRHYRLPFKGFGGISTNQLSVFSNGITFSANTDWVTVTNNPTKQGTSTAPTFGCAVFGGNYALRLINTPRLGTDKGSWIRFDTTAGLIINANDRITVVSRDRTANDGSFIVGVNASTAALTHNSTFTGVGAAIPIYGLSDICDFGKRSFPRAVALYSGRLVLGGFPDAPMRVALSNLLDPTTLDVSYNNFQTLLETPSEINALFFDLNGNADDRVTAVSEFQNSLFIFCKNGIYRVSGTDGVITPTSYNISFVASIGCLNPQSVVKVDKTLFFVNTSGVYDIVPTIEAGDFTAGEKSIKIKNQFNNTKPALMEAATWAMYDSVNQEVYVSISLDSDNIVSFNEIYGCSRLYVYSILRDAWFEYGLGLQGVFRNIAGVISSEGLNKGRDVIVYSLATDPQVAVPDSRIVPTLLDGQYPIDGAWINIYDTSSPDTEKSESSLAGLQSPLWRNTLDSFLVEPLETELFIRKDIFNLIPLEDVIDCKVTETSLGVEAELIYGEDWVKTTRNSIVLLKPFNFYRQINFYKTAQDNTKGFTVFVNNEKKTEGVDYTLTSTGLLNWLIAPAVGDVVTTGFVYDAWHFTPTNCLDNLEEDKRFIKYIGNYKNPDGTLQYKPVCDVNVAFVYGEAQSGFISTDLYGNDDLYWDDALFDIPSSAKQYRPYTRLVESILGHSHSIQVCNFNRSTGVFELAGYQLVIKKGGKNARHWST